MRPVNKGNSPYTRIGDYGEAQPYLENRIGRYCSFCEFPISHVPEVEHIAAKTKGGDLTAWDNLLLGCKYCNTRKGIKVTTENVEEFLWPDRYNTALAYTYDYGVPKVHETLLETVDPSGDVLNKAQNLFELVKLDNQPKLGEKDRRARQRNKVFTQARDSLADYLESKNEAMLRQIIRTAVSAGFFSVWMNVFRDEPEVWKALIDAFPGTVKTFYNENGSPKTVLEREEELVGL